MKTIFESQAPCVSCLAVNNTAMVVDFSISCDRLLHEGRKTKANVRCPFPQGFADFLVADQWQRWGVGPGCQPADQMVSQLQSHPGRLQVYWRGIRPGENCIRLTTLNQSHCVDHVGRTLKFASDMPVVLRLYDPISKLCDLYQKPYLAVHPWLAGESLNAVRRFSTNIPIWVRILVGVHISWDDKQEFLLN